MTDNEPNPLDELLAAGVPGDHTDVYCVDYEDGEREWFLDEPGGLWHQAVVTPARVEPVVDAVEVGDPRWEWPGAK